MSVSKTLITYDRVVCVMHGIVTATLTAGLLWNAPQILRVIQLYATGAVQ